jgi:hypothetical protein
MTKRYTIQGAVAALVLIGTSLQAVPIIGSINFEGGTVHLNGSLTTATEIMSFGDTTIVSPNSGTLPTGDYAGTQNSVVTFGSGFTFSPSSAYVDSPPLWTFTYLGNIYSFDMMSVVSSVGVGPSLDIAGTGMLSITGLTPTPGTFTFATTGVGSGLDTFTFGFVAGNIGAAVPDGANALVLFGVALSGLGIYGRKFVA